MTYIRHITPLILLGCIIMQVLCTLGSDLPFFVVVECFRYCKRHAYKLSFPSCSPPTDEYKHLAARAG